MKSFYIISAFMIAAIIGQAQTCPDSNHPHAIDLGLPSGTKWACCNVGANAPETYGSYFAFGETKEKEIYDYKNYSLINTTLDGHPLPPRSDLASDVASVKWGEEWHIPSIDQFNELKNNCTSVWKTVKGVNGRLFTGNNGNSVFIPTGGKIITFCNDSEGKMGLYWLNTECGGNERKNAYYFYITNSSVGTFKGGKFYGLPVRPIKK